MVNKITRDRLIKFLRCIIYLVLYRYNIYLQNHCKSYEVERLFCNSAVGRSLKYMNTETFVKLNKNYYITIKHSYHYETFIKQ